MNFLNQVLYMKSVLHPLLLSLTFLSCNTEDHKQKQAIDHHIDTLIYHADIFKDADGYIIPHKTFDFKSKSSRGLPKNEEIIMKLHYKGDYAKLIQHCNTELVPDTNLLLITKIDNTTYTLFIDPAYSDSLISMSYYLTPKKNYVMKVYFQNELVRYPEKTVGAKWIQLVESY
jgi:hypothetical protein